MLAPTYTMIRPVKVSTRPKFANRMNSGMTAVITGSDWMTNSRSAYPETILLRPRESTYPAGAATITDTTTVARATSRLFCSHVGVRVSVST